jgi:hypothetical protein
MTSRSSKRAKSRRRQRKAGPSSTSSLKVYTRAQVAEHNSAKDCWIIVGSKVYDISNFLKRHPGGSAPLRYAGGDTTPVFNKIHPESVLNTMGDKFEIGVLDSNEHFFDENSDDGDDDAGLESAYNAKADPDGYNVRSHSASKEAREFGDLMAGEGEVSHIPKVVLCIYFFLMGYSYVTARLTGCSLLVVPAYYIVGMVGFYNWHRMAHSEWLHELFVKWGFPYFAELHEIHMEHHLERFPPTDFYGSAKLFAKLYPSGKPTIWSLMDLTKTTNIADGTAMESSTAKTAKKKKCAGNSAPAHSFLAHEWPVVLTGSGILFCGMLPPFRVSGATTGMVFVLYFLQASLMNALHMSFHVRNFHLEKYKWYLELRTLHYIHHLGDMKTNFAMMNLGLDGFFKSLAIEDHRLKGGKRRKGYYQQVVHGKRDNHFPHGITRNSVLLSAQHAGMSSQILGFHLQFDEADAASARRKTKKGFPAVLLRVTLTCTCMYLWWNVYAWLGPAMEHIRPPDTLDGNPKALALEAITPAPDIGHLALSPVNKWLMEGEGSPRAVFCCALSDFFGEIMCLAAILISLFGVSFRPVLSGLLVLVTRLLLELVLSANMLIVPTEKISDWQETGRHFFVKPYVGYSFVSARVAFSTVIVLELLSISVHGQGEQFFGRVRTKHKAMAGALAGFLMLFQTGITIALHESWTFDVLIAILLARLSGILADRYTPWLDVFVP